MACISNNGLTSSFVFLVDLHNRFRDGLTSSFVFLVDLRSWVAVRSGVSKLFLAKAFIGAYAGSGAMRDKVESCRPRARDDPDLVPFQRPGSVQSGSRTYTTLEIQHGVYTPDEFLVRYKASHDKYGYPLVKLEHNNELQPEMVVMVPGDLTAPRRYLIGLQTFHEANKNEMPRQLTEKQPFELLTSLWHKVRNVSWGVGRKSIKLPSGTPEGPAGQSISRATVGVLLTSELP